MPKTASPILMILRKIYSFHFSSVNLKVTLNYSKSECVEMQPDLKSSLGLKHSSVKKIDFSRQQIMSQNVLQVYE